MRKARIWRSNRIFEKSVTVVSEQQTSGEQLVLSCGRHSGGHGSGDGHPPDDRNRCDLTGAILKLCLNKLISGAETQTVNRRKSS